ncbi:FKBP-type peptidyl-prolyl cis-trans isomerase [Chloropicon primus]|uniref:peptidylprolyl isomerase n=2 Tax=Chloropicon primus TaxID=1764295 RepID=A0A5B8MBN5_9CHLO|nr:FKBP-type peptidyl-prolyl cis-trans isomerase [Chloropicon primus]|eukprot:QDZ17511.1 FKBP-type peptidyl-prolyl cis-trans isomerase [Chloropicon primus]
MEGLGTRAWGGAGRRGKTQATTTTTRRRTRGREGEAKGRRHGKAWSTNDGEEGEGQGRGEQSVRTRGRTPSVRKADSTDAVSTFLTRRFGLAGGLAWVGVLAFGVISEQVKTRLEVKREFETTVDVGADAEVVKTESGIAYQDVKLGGGQTPRRGDLVVVQYKAEVEGVGTYEDTRKNTKAGAAFVFGSRPLPPGLPLGFEEVLSTMKVGGKRIAEVPPSLGFGDEVTFIPSKLRKGDTVEIPPNSTIKYEVELTRVSIPPS